MSEFKKRIFSSIFLLPATIYIIIQGSIIFNIVLILCFFLTIYEWHTICNKKKFYYMGILFLFFSFYSIFYLRHNFQSDYYYFLSIIIICISTDIGGYFFGKFFKGPRITKISPNKTYAGLFGGYLLSFVFSFFIFRFFNLVEFDDFINLKILFLIFSISLISQIGDFIISYFKRTFKVKDTGMLIPGHGGLLDRIDGIIFAFPYSFILVKFELFWIF